MLNKTELHHEISMIKKDYHFKMEAIGQLSADDCKTYGNIQAIERVHDGFFVLFAIHSSPLSTVVWFSADFKERQVIVQQPGLSQLVYLPGQQALFFCVNKSRAGSEFAKGNFNAAFVDPENGIVGFDMKGNQLYQFRVASSERFFPFSLAAYGHDGLAVYDMATQEISITSFSGEVRHTIPIPGKYPRRIKTYQQGHIFFNTYARKNNLALPTEEATENIYQVQVERSLTMAMESELRGEYPFQLMDFEVVDNAIFYITEKYFRKVNRAGQIIYNVQADRILRQYGGLIQYLMCLSKDARENHVYYAVAYINGGERFVIFKIEL